MTKKQKQKDANDVLVFFATTHSDFCDEHDKPLERGWYWCLLPPNFWRGEDDDKVSLDAYGPFASQAAAMADAQTVDGTPKSAKIRL